MTRKMKKKIIRGALRTVLFLAMFFGMVLAVLSILFCFVVDTKYMTDLECLTAVAVMALGIAITYANAKLYNYFFE